MPNQDSCYRKTDILAPKMTAGDIPLNLPSSKGKKVASCIKKAGQFQETARQYEKIQATYA